MLELSRPTFGDRTHIRYVGQQVSLCGVRVLGRYPGYDSQQVLERTTCRSCRKSWQSLSPQQRRLILNGIS